MVKILFYNHTGQVGGAERLLLTLLQQLDRSQFDSVLVCPAEGPLNQLAKQSGVATQTIEGLKARFTWRLDHLFQYLLSFAQVILQLRKTVSDVEPDLIHANSVRAGLVATIATVGFKQRVVWHIHDLLPRHPFNVIIRGIASLSARSRILAVAQASADRLVGNHSGLRRRAMVIPNAVDLDKFTARNDARECLRRELQIEAHAPVIGMIGRLTPAKGQLEMLQLFPKVLAQIPDAKLLIVGAPAFNNEHEYLALLNQTIARMNLSDRVHMLGARDDIPDILRALDLLVINSASEACSLVILEAMAGGTPVLATSTGGTPEIIDHQRNGWLVRFHNDDELFAGIVTMLTDSKLRERLSSEARIDVANRYSIPRFITQMVSFYSALLTERTIPQQKNLPSLKVNLSAD
jgi:glycosyltransferase involved in cell wall biosynthesis